MKFVMIMEGQTEKKSITAFFKRWLDPQLDNPVGILPVNVKGSGNFKNEVAKKTKHHLNSSQNKEIIAVIGLIDLHECGIDFPKNLTSIKQKYDHGVRHYEKKVNYKDRFHMFFAVHEYEAWLLSQPDIFPPKIQNDIKKKPQPEKVNFDTPPAKFLDNLYQKHTKKGYKKVTQGKILFPKLSPEVAISKCPYLEKMLSKMLALAKEAGA